MQINRWRYLSSSSWEIPLRCDLLRKKHRLEKISRKSNWNALALQRSLKYLLLRIHHSNSTFFPKSGGEKKRNNRGNYKAFCFSSKCNKKASVLPPFSYKTNARINYFKITESDLLSMIKSLDSTKGDGYDNLSVRMIKVCSESITLPLKVTFQESVNTEKISLEQTNVVSVNKKRRQTF